MLQNWIVGQVIAVSGVFAAFGLVLLPIAEWAIALRVIAELAIFLAIALLELVECSGTLEQHYCTALPVLVYVGIDLFYDPC